MLNMHKTYKTVLEGVSRTLLSCLTLLGAMLPVACVYEQMPEGKEEADTYIHLNLSSTESQTRAVSDKHEGEGQENTITSLRVWAFDSDNQSENAIALCYQEETSLQATDGKHTFTMKLPRKTGGQDLKRIDLYILANAESGSNLATAAENRMLTRAQLQSDKAITELFGVNSQGDPQCVVVPKSGLPMSRIVQNIPISQYVTESPDVAKPSIGIPLTRSVSKLHFFFARRTDAGTDNVQVTGIEVGASTIPMASHVFPLPVSFATPVPDDAVDTRAYTTYVQYAVSQRATVMAGDIPEVTDPKTLTRGSDEDADAYMSRLDRAGLKSKYLTYLRETDKEVPVTIYYRLGENEAERSATVNVKAGDLRRNHEVVIYGYFLDGGALMVEPQVLPWSDAGNFDFKATREVTLSYADGDVRMTNECVAIAYQDWTTGATPVRSPKITFKINTDSHRWILQTDNPDFGFLLEGEEQLRDQLTGYDGTVSFYFLPRKEFDGVSATNWKASIFMTLPEDDNTRVLINTGKHKLPGNDDHINFYQVGPNDYDKLK